MTKSKKKKKQRTSPISLYYKLKIYKNKAQIFSYVFSSSSFRALLLFKAACPRNHTLPFGPERGGKRRNHQRLPALVKVERSRKAQGRNFYCSSFNYLFKKRQRQKKKNFFGFIKMFLPGRDI